MRLLPVPLRDEAVRRPFLRWAAIGGLIRLLLLPIGITSDTLAVYWRAHLISFHGEVYADYLVNMGSHLVHAVWLRIVQPLLGPVDELWTHPWWWADSFGLIPQHMTAFLAQPDAWRAIALLKLPYVIAELVAGVVLLHLVCGRGDAADRAPATIARARRMWILWMLSPAAIYATLLFARYEAFPVLAVLGALLLAERDRPWAAALVLGIAITLRTYPIVLVPVFALVLQRGLPRQIAWTAVGLAPFGLSMLVNRLVAGTFGEVVAVGDYTYGSNWLAWSFAPGPGRGEAGIPLFPAVLVVLGVYLLGRDRGWWGTGPVLREDLWRWVVITHLVMFATTLFSAHYLMWIMPAIALLVARSEVRAVVPLHLVQVAGVFVAAFLLWGGILFTGTLGGLGPTAQRLLPLGSPLPDAQLLSDLAWTTSMAATLALLLPFLSATIRLDRRSAA